MNTEKEYIAYINKALSEIHYPAQPKGLYEPIAYTLDCGGKRIRPMLMLAAAEALGADKSVAVNQAVDRLNNNSIANHKIPFIKSSKITKFRAIRH